MQGEGLLKVIEDKTVVNAADATLIAIELSRSKAIARRVFQPAVMTATAIALLFCASLDAAIPVAANPVTNPADNLPDRPGKDSLLKACSNCHQPDIVIGQKRDLAGWQEIVDQMVARGATVDEAETQAIIAYLTDSK